MTELEQLEVHDDPHDYTEEEAIRAAKIRARLIPVITKCDRVLVDYARVNGGFSFGGEESAGKMLGATHVYDQASKVKAINCSVAADWIDNAPDRGQLIQMALEKIPSTWLPGWVRQFCPDMLKYLDGQEDGWVEQTGNFSLEVRATAPDPERNVVRNQEESNAV